MSMLTWDNIPLPMLSCLMKVCQYSSEGEGHFKRDVMRGCCLDKFALVTVCIIIYTMFVLNIVSMDFNVN